MEKTQNGFAQIAGPLLEAENRSSDDPLRISNYCLSYTAVLVNFLPVESVPVMVTVRVLPSAETTPRPLIVTLSPFLLVNASVRSSTFLYERVSVVGSHVTG
jgi:hypothetical protein